jgi:hypothetical protein
MRMRLVILLTILGISVASAQQSSGPGWPPLPTSGFISGRPATDKDIMEGNAVFALRAYGVPFGKPLDVVIPQYAYLTKRGQRPIPVIVVQAELGKGLKIFGVRDLSGKTATARDSELQLLGTHPPN